MPTGKLMKGWVVKTDQPFSCLISCMWCRFHLSSWLEIEIKWYHVSNSLIPCVIVTT